MIPTILLRAGPALLLSGCVSAPVFTGSTEAPTIAVHEVASVDLAGVLPSDVVLRADGSTLVLDGYAGQILSFGPDGSAKGAWTAAGIGRPVRLSPAADGGVWAAVPGLDGDAGLAVHLDANGTIAAIVAPKTADGAALHPVDIAEQERTLLVADRAGGLAWVDSGTGIVSHVLEEDRDQNQLRRVVDLAEDGEGGWIAVDTLAPRILRISPQGAPGASFSRPGLNVGQLGRPTAAAALARGATLLSDSMLGSVQAFDADGDIIGVFADDTGPIHFDHPVAVRATTGSPTRVAVLEAQPARLRLYTIDPLPPAPPPSLIKTALVKADADPAGTNGASCLQCHDGLVLDSREVWDPARTHHPVGVVPERVLPAIFKLDAGGKMVCTTCHSPHGVVESPDDRANLLIRHRSESSPFTRMEKDGDALCIACHADDAHVDTGTSTLDPKTAGHPTGAALVTALKARAKTGVGPSDPTTASCMSCHAMHGATGDHITRDPGDGATCLGCHPAVRRTGSNHPLGRVPGSDLIANHQDERVTLSNNGGIGCLTCHDLEGSRANHLVRTLPSGTPVCLDCHTSRTDLQGGKHARLARGTLPTCVACHDVHGGDKDAHFLTAIAGNPGDPGGCLACHGPGRRAASGGSPGQAGHPVDGQAIVGKDPLTCLSCHDPHSASEPSSKDCADCHVEQSADADRGGHGAATCLDCHPAHRASAPTTSRVNPASARCLACHAEGSTSEKAQKIASYEHPSPAFLPDGTRWSPLGGLLLYAKDGTPMTVNTNGDLTCQSCHLVHGPSAAGDDNLRRAGGWQAACSSCHGDDALVLYRYFHQPERRADLRGETP